tara:strand:- start:532 stop:753 length:222 start_codon:yes stop_codon:yes gene_type:complete
MIVKGDIILVSSSNSKFAGLTGKVKKVRKRTHKAIVKVYGQNTEVWIEIEHLIKISEKQQKDFEKILKERKNV